MTASFFPQQLQTLQNNTQFVVDTLDSIETYPNEYLALSVTFILSIVWTIFHS